MEFPTITRIEQLLRKYGDDAKIAQVDTHLLAERILRASGLSVNNEDARSAALDAANRLQDAEEVTA
jgi:hypothetical protein